MRRWATWFGVMLIGILLGEAFLRWGGGVDRSDPDGGAIEGLLQAEGGSGGAKPPSGNDGVAPPPGASMPSDRASRELATLSRLARHVPSQVLSWGSGRLSDDACELIDLSEHERSLVQGAVDGAYMRIRRLEEVHSRLVADPLVSGMIVVEPFPEEGEAVMDDLAAAVAGVLGHARAEVLLAMIDRPRELFGTFGRHPRQIRLAATLRGNEGGGSELRMMRIRDEGSPTPFSVTLEVAGGEAARYDHLLELHGHDIDE